MRQEKKVNLTLSSLFCRDMDTIKYYVSKVALRDLFGRFAALKNSLPSHNRKIEIDSFYIVRRQQEEESNVEEAEVEKVIK